MANQSLLPAPPALPLSAATPELGAEAPILPVTQTPLQAFRAKFPVYDTLSDTDLAGRLYAKHYAGSMSQPEFAAKIGLTPDPGPAASAALGAVHGVTAGFDDELAGQVASAAVSHPLSLALGPVGIINARVYDWLTGSTRGDETAKQVTDLVRNNDAAAWENHPYLYGGGTVAGGIASAAAVPELGVAKGLGIGASGIKALAARGAIAGSGYGAVDAAGNANPDTNASLPEAMAQRGQAAVVGGLTGAVVGAGLSPAASWLTKLGPIMRMGYDAAANPVDAGQLQVAAALARDNQGALGVAQRMTPAVAPFFNRTINAVLDEAGKDTTGKMLPAGIADAVNASAPRGTPKITAGMAQQILDAFQKDVAPWYEGKNLVEAARTTRPGLAGHDPIITTPNTMDLMKDAAQMPGTGKAAILNAMRQRQADAPDAIAQTIDQTTGAAAFDQRVTQVGDQRGSFQARYGELYDQPIQNLNASGALDRLSQSSTFAKALALAKEDAHISGAPVPDINAMTPRSIDMVQRQLRSMGTGQAGEGGNPALGLAQSARKQFTTLADTALEKFAGIRGAWANQLDQETALEMGRSLGINKGNSAAKELEFFREHAAAYSKAVKAGDTAAAQNAQAVMDNFRAGFGQSLKDMLEKGKGNNQAGQLLSDMGRRQAEARVREILTPANADRIMAMMQNERAKQEFSTQLYSGPDTAYKIARGGGYQSLVKVGTALGHFNLPGAASAATEILTAARNELRNNAINRAAVPPQNALVLRRQLRSLAARQGAPAAVYPYIAPLQNAPAALAGNALANPRQK